MGKAGKRENAPGWRGLVDSSHVSIRLLGQPESCGHCPFAHSRQGPLQETPVDSGIILVAWKGRKKQGFLFEKLSKICDHFEVSPGPWPVFLKDVALLLLKNRMLMKSGMKCCYRCSALHYGCWNYHHILNQFPEHCLEVMSPK